jgi:Zn finger protein HypA/HybF involved in hydrogenase expression
MTTHAPIEINGTEYAPNVVACPSCDAAIDAQRALIAGECPECRTPARALCATDSGEAPPEDYEPESYQVEA